MAKNMKNSSSIVAINKVTQTIFGLSGNQIFEHDFGRTSRANETYVSYVPFKDIITTTVEIPRSVEDADLLDTIVIKVYDDLGLDSELDYKITYTEIVGGSGDGRMFNVFVIDNQILNTEFDAIAARTNYIDYITTSPFLYKNLYDRGILTKDSVDCFIYLQQDDAFLVIYQNGEYLQARQLRYNLKFINDKFGELIGNKIDFSSFKLLLSTYGINLENQEERDYMIQIFDDMFYYISDIINSLNKIYNIKIQNVYFGSDIGKIAGVEIFIENVLNLAYRDFNFNIATNMKEYELTQLDILMFLGGQKYMQDKNDEYNYSPFKRPPPLAQRNSGRLIGYALLGLLLGAAWPLYQYGHGFYNDIVANQKQKELDEINAKLAVVQKESKEIQDKVAKIRKEFTAENTKLQNRKGLIDGIFEKKTKYAMKGVAIHSLSNLVNNSNGAITRIVNDDRNITVGTTTGSDKQMTELLKDISVASENDIKYAVYTRSIVLDENNNSVSYDSNISVEIGK